MFLTELTPLIQSSLGQPIAFFGGLLAGALRWDLSQDPVKCWLDQQLGQSTGSASPSTATTGAATRPTNIEIE